MLEMLYCSSLLHHIVRGVSVFFTSETTYIALDAKPAKPIAPTAEKLGPCYPSRRCLDSCPSSTRPETCWFLHRSDVSDQAKFQKPVLQDSQYFGDTVRNQAWLKVKAACSLDLGSPFPEKIPNDLPGPRVEIV